MCKRAEFNRLHSFNSRNVAWTKKKAKGLRISQNKPIHFKCQQKLFFLGRRKKKTDHTHHVNTLPFVATQTRTVCCAAVQAEDPVGMQTDANGEFRRGRGCVQDRSHTLRVFVVPAMTKWLLTRSCIWSSTNKLIFPKRFYLYAREWKKTPSTYQYQKKIPDS